MSLDLLSVLKTQTDKVVREQLQAAKVPEKKELEDVSLSDLEFHTKELEKLCNEYAETGYYQLTYNMGNLNESGEKEYSRVFVNRLSRYFKDKHPTLMVISDLGRRHIIIDWSGYHDC